MCFVSPKRKYVYVAEALFIVLFFFQCTGTELVRRVKQNPDRLYWSETRMLRWDDFQGTPLPSYSEIFT